MNHNLLIRLSPAREVHRKVVALCIDRSICIKNQVKFDQSEREVIYYKGQYEK